MPEKEKMWVGRRLPFLQIGMVVLGSPDPQSAVHCEDSAEGGVSIRASGTADGLCLVEGVGTVTIRFYQNDQGVENVVGAADKIVRCTNNINNGAGPGGAGTQET